MRQPYQLLLGDYQDHPLMADHLKGNVPDFQGMLESKHWKSISDTERLMWSIAQAFYTGSPEARVRDLAKLDRQHLNRFIGALLVAKWTTPAFAKAEFGVISALIRDQIDWDE